MTIIPVRENSEVVIIYQDIWILCERVKTYIFGCRDEDPANLGLKVHGFGQVWTHLF